jgi:hypothetical protein
MYNTRKCEFNYVNIINPIYYCKKEDSYLPCLQQPLTQVCMGVRVWARVQVVLVVAFGVAIVDMGVHSRGQRRGGLCRQGPAEGACGTARRRVRGSVP